MELKNYISVDVTNYLREKYKKLFDETICEVIFYEEVTSKLKWIKIVKEIKSDFGHANYIKELVLNGKKGILDFDKYDSFEDTIKAVCNDERLLHHSFNILTNAARPMSEDTFFGISTIEGNSSFIQKNHKEDFRQKYIVNENIPILDRLNKFYFKDCPEELVILCRKYAEKGNTEAWSYVKI